MFGFLAVVVALLLFGPAILSLRNLVVMGELRRALTEQRREIEALKRAAAAPRAEPAPVAAPAAEDEAPAPIVFEAWKDLARETPGTTPAEETAAPDAPKTEPSRTLERQFGGRAFVWLGGVALALAGFFLVKYSIDIGLLTESVRVVLGVLFGLALLGGSQAVRARKGLADGVRIAQALAGAGIADLYGSLFAATTLYHLLPSWFGFGAMAVVTATALILSLRHGIPIAVLGLVGGYATPMLIHGDPNAPVLFGYLYLVFGGLAVVIRRQRWHWLSIPAAAVGFAWVVLWLLTGHAIQDGAWMSLFLLGVAATSALVDRAEPVAPFSVPFWLRNFAPAAALALMACVTFATHYSLFEWSVFGLFSAGAIALAWFDSRSYAIAPWLALAANLLMLWGWFGAAHESLVIALAAFAALFTLSSLLLLDRSDTPLSWAAMTTASLIAYLLLAYARLGDSLHRAIADQADWVWAGLAFAGAAMLAVSALRSFVARSDASQRHRLQEVFAGGAAALVAFGLLILLDHKYSGLAIAAQMTAAAYLATRTDMPALRHIAYALAALFGLLLIPELGRLTEATTTGFGIAPPDLLSIIVFTYAAPAALFAVSSVLLRREKDDIFVQVVELLSLALVALMSYRIVEFGFQGSPATLTLYAGSIFNNVLLLLSLAAFRVARRFYRVAALWGACALAVWALLRIAVFNLVFENPLWAHVLIGEAALVNGLLLGYGLPAVIGFFLARDLDRADLKPYALAARIASFVLAFVYISLGVRQIFTGAYLDTGSVTAAEIYTYSAVWLVTGIGLLFAAVLRRDMTMRIASLAVLLLTIGKVFLYDASALTGLWRVVSFLGLGLSLIGLSWFYSRFVFVSEKAAEST